MLSNSFSFGHINSLEQWGMRVVAVDTLLPQKRSRKQIIPGRSGVYDFGSNAFDERILRLECCLISPTKFTKAQLREMAYLLSEKNQLRLSDEPDKFYIAELFSPPEVLTEAAGHVHSVTLEFICAPFAHRERVSMAVSSGTTPIRYEGTAPAPILLTLTNHGSSTVSGVSVTVVHRSKNPLTAQF